MMLNLDELLEIPGYSYQVVPQYQALARQASPEEVEQVIHECRQRLVPACIKSGFSHLASLTRVPDETDRTIPPFTLHLSPEEKWYEIILLALLPEADQARIPRLPRTARDDIREALLTNAVQFGDDPEGGIFLVNELPYEIPGTRQFHSCDEYFEARTFSQLVDDLVEVADLLHAHDPRMYEDFFDCLMYSIGKGIYA